MKFKFMKKPCKKDIQLELESDMGDLDTTVYTNASRSVAADTAFMEKLDSCFIKAPAFYLNRTMKD